MNNDDIVEANVQISVLTYNVKHRKTYDTLCLLKALGYKNVAVYATPFTYKKQYKPILEHRPPVTEYIPCTERICQNFGYFYCEGNNITDFSINERSIVLICGAGIIPNEFIIAHRIINAHPGFIPNCRGLDAFKWAIYENQPIGVTTHLLGEYVDAGEIIERKEIDIYPNDTFHSLAQRVYENEIGMLVGAVSKINDTHDVILPEDYIVHKRMPHEYEAELLNRLQIRIGNLE